MDTATRGYSHTQKAPLCLIPYGSGITAITLAVLIGDYLGIVIAGSVSLVLLLLAPCFHYLAVEDQGDVLAIRFGPVPLFRRTVRYADIGPRWHELFPHLKEIGIEVTLHDDLTELEEVCLDFLRQMRKTSPGPIIMLSPRPAHVGKQFPAISAWVQESGWIEVGRRKEGGIAARALDDNGLVFENNISNTLTEAMAALEEGLTGRFKDHESALRSSSLTVKKRQRRRHDA